MHIRVEHLTRHRYEAPVSFSEHKLYLRPLDNHLRRITHFKVETVPASRQRWVRDAYGNLVLVCNFGLEESDVLEFHTTFEAQMVEENPFDFILEPYAIAYPFKYTDEDARALSAYLEPAAKPGALNVLNWFYSAVDTPNAHPNVVQFLSDINEAIRRDISYVRRDEEGIQTPDETLNLRTGSCRDMAVLFMAIVRQLGLAARFVSGYLYDPPVESGGEHVFNRAVGSMHAWTEVYLPGAGWKGFDPTNGILANSYFLPSGVSHNPGSVDPVQGVYYAKQSVASELEVDLQLETLKHDT